VTPIKAAVAWALGAGDDVSWRLHLELASISRLDRRGATPVVHSFGETVHLA
jgi:hypothetical protein